MSIREVWNKYNVSTIMVLPLFWKVNENIYAKGGAKLKFPFVQLVFEYGLLNTYLYRNNKYKKSLFLLFDREIFSTPRNITDSKYNSMAELLFDSEYYQGLEVSENLVIIRLKIPGQFLDDIQYIENSEYSKLSKEYKKEIQIKGTRRKRGMTVPKDDSLNELAHYMATNNLGNAIARKALHIKKELEELLGINLTDSDEYYQAFNRISENLNRQKIYDCKRISSSSTSNIKKS